MIGKYWPSARKSHIFSEQDITLIIDKMSDTIY
jgi:hypothetical protein